MASVTLQHSLHEYKIMQAAIVRSAEKRDQLSLGEELVPLVMELHIE